MTFVDDQAAWRPMTPADLPAVLSVAGMVHPAYPEDEAVFAERQRLFPAGCNVLASPDALRGYVVSHPWRRGEPPALNSLLGSIPAQPTSFYIHDLALLPTARGTGAGGVIVAHLADVAKEAGLPCLSLVAVGQSPGFWQRQGFRVAHDPGLAVKLASYDDAARYMERELDPDAAGVTKQKR
ncbi:acetyltransferase (GNAT) family protein [Bosea sp. 124]|nr:acetyltransferase (GNAT) family protein [Bosea sp. 124]